MNADVHPTNTLAGLDHVQITERQRARVQDALRQSDMIVSGVLALGRFLGFTAPARLDSK